MPEQENCGGRNWRWWINSRVCVEVNVEWEDVSVKDSLAGKFDAGVAEILRRLADQLDPQEVDGAAAAYQAHPPGSKTRQPGMSTLPKPEDLWQLREDAQPQEGSLSQKRKPSLYRYPHQIRKRVQQLYDQDVSVVHTQQRILDEFGVPVGPSAIYAWRNQRKRKRLHGDTAQREEPPPPGDTKETPEEAEQATTYPLAPQKTNTIGSPTRRTYIPPEIKARVRELDDQRAKPAEIVKRIQVEFGLALNIGTLYSWRKGWKKAGKGGSKTVLRPKQDGTVEVIRPPKAPPDVSAARNQMDRIYSFAKGRLLSGQSSRQVVDAIQEKFNVTIPEEKIVHWKSQLKTPRYPIDRVSQA